MRRLEAAATRRPEPRSATLFDLLAGGARSASLEAVATLVGAVAALAVKHGKPLAARLLPIPSVVAGDAVRIDNPRLTEGVVMDPAS